MEERVRWRRGEAAAVWCVDARIVRTRPLNAGGGSTGERGPRAGDDGDPLMIVKRADEGHVAERELLAFGNQDSTDFDFARWLVRDVGIQMVARLLDRMNAGSKEGGAPNVVLEVASAKELRKLRW